MELDAYVDNVVAAAEAYRVTKDAKARMVLREKTRLLHEASSTPAERMDVIRFTPTLQVVLRVTHVSGLLQALTDLGDRASVADLAGQTQRDELLTLRMLRPLTAARIIDEVGSGQFAANEMTAYCLKKGVVGSVKIYSELMYPLYAHLARLAEDPSWDGFATDTRGDAFTQLYGMPMFAYLPAHPEYNKAFADFMTDGRSTDSKAWFKTFPAEEALSARPVKDGSVLFVDIAGGQGQWTVAFKNSLPKSQLGRFVVQDLRSVIDATTRADGVEYVPYDIFTPQPIKGARFYLLKAIIHDWQDAKALQILSNVREAMEEGYSTLLINDLVFPEQGVTLRDACLDIAIMAQLGAVERNEKQIRDLLQAAALKIVKIWRKDDTLTGNESVIECERI